MKKLLHLLILLIWLPACESDEQKQSRLTLDKYTRKLNVLLKNSINPQEEQNSPRLFSNKIFQDEIEKFSQFNADIEFEIIIDDYKTPKNNLLKISDKASDLLGIRNNIFSSLSDCLNTFNKFNRSITEVRRIMNGNYERDVFLSVYFDQTIDEMKSISISKARYEITRINLTSSIDNYTSAMNELDSLVLGYNSLTQGLNLSDSAIIFSKMHPFESDWIFGSIDELLKFDISEIYDPLNEQYVNYMDEVLKTESQIPEEPNVLYFDSYSSLDISESQVKKIADEMRKYVKDNQLITTFEVRKNYKGKLSVKAFDEFHFLVWDKEI